MSTRPESRRILALVVTPRAEAELVTLAEAALAIAPFAEVHAPDTVLLDASAAHLLGGEAQLAAAALALARALELEPRAAVADGLWAARALAMGAGDGGTAAALEAREPQGSHGHPRAVAKMISRNLHDRVVPAPALIAPTAEPARPPVVIAPPGENARALAALPVTALGLPPALIERLTSLGLLTLGAIAALPTRSLAARFGALGEQAVARARGIDPTPLVPHVPHVLPEESRELEGGVEALEPLLFLVKGLAERLATRLAAQVRGATALELTLAQESREVHRAPLLLTTPSASTALWMPVLKEAIERLRLPSPVVRLTLAATGVAPLVREQLGLDDHPERVVALEAVLSRLESRLGEGTVLVARARDRHRPEGAFALERFDPAAKPPKPGAEVTPARKRSRTRTTGRSGGRVRVGAAEAREGAVWRDGAALQAEGRRGDGGAREEARAREDGRESNAGDTGSGADDGRVAAELPDFAPVLSLPKPQSVEQAPPRDDDTGSAHILAFPGLAAAPRAEAATPPRARAEAARVRAEATAGPATALPRPTRLCAAPEPIELLHEGDRCVAARVGAQVLPVTALSDRERLVGEWWLPRPFDRTYARIQLHGLGEYWIFYSHRDGRTYIHGYFD